jgi:hypothetical protein
MEGKKPYHTLRKAAIHRTKPLYYRYEHVYTRIATSEGIDFCRKWSPLAGIWDETLEHDRYGT